MYEEKQSHFQFIKQIGEGSFGSIHLVKHYKSKDNHGPEVVYALKKVEMKKMTQEDIDDSKMEFLIHKTLRCDYIVKYQAHFIDKGCICILLEFMDGGDLGQYIESRNEKLIKEEIIWKYFIQTCLGIQYLHSRRILHRDLKSTNLFLSKNGELKIGDLGVAKELKTNWATTIVGTPYYLSPELWEEKPYNNKSDIWSLGCILYEMCTLHHPFDCKSIGGLYLKIIKSDYKPIPSLYSPALSDIIEACLQKDYSKRPTIDIILGNPTLMKEAKKLGLKIPTQKELSLEIKLQKMDMMSTFARKKNKSKVRPKASKFYKRSTTQNVDFKRGHQGNSNKIGPTITKPILPTKLYSNKASIDLISSQIWDVADDILQSSSNETNHKPSYLKYVRQIISTKPKDLENSSDKNVEKDRKSVNNSAYDNYQIKISQPNVPSNKRAVKRSCTALDQVDTQDNSNIDNSILQAYQILSKRKNAKPSLVKPSSKKFSREPQSALVVDSRMKKRKSAVDNKVCFEENSDKSPLPFINLPTNKETHKMSEHDESIGSNSKNASAKSSRSVRELLSPHNAQAKVQFKEPKDSLNSGSKANNIFKMKKMRKCTFDESADQVTSITIDINSLKDSTKDSSYEKKLKKEPLSAQKPSSLKRVREEKSSDARVDLKPAQMLISNSEGDSNTFEGEIDEQEMDEALNYTDMTFEGTEEADESFEVAHSTIEKQNSTDLHEFNEDSKIKEQYLEQIKSIEVEIADRWNTLNKFCDEETAKKCFEFFKSTFEDSYDFNDQEKMEKAHKFIKKQEITNYRAMGYEWFKLLNSYIDLNDMQNDISALDI